MARDVRAQKVGLVFLKYAREFLRYGVLLRGGSVRQQTRNTRARVGFAALRKRGGGKVCNKPRKVQIIIEGF